MRRPTEAEVRAAVTDYFSKAIPYEQFVHRLGPLVPVGDKLELALFEARYLHAFDREAAANTLKRARRRALRIGRRRLAAQCLFDLQLLFSRSGDHRTAARLCRLLVKEDRSASALLFLASEEEASGNRNEARRAYQKLLRRRGMKQIARKHLAELS